MIGIVLTVCLMKAVMRLGYQMMIVITIKGLRVVHPTLTNRKCWTIVTKRSNSVWFHSVASEADRRKDGIMQIL